VTLAAVVILDLRGCATEEVHAARFPGMHAEATTTDELLIVLGTSSSGDRASADDSENAAARRILVAPPAPANLRQMASASFAARS